MSEREAMAEYPGREKLKVLEKKICPSACCPP
jgi:hypothetical protein